MHIFPTSSLGKWGMFLAAAWPVCTIVGTALANGCYRGVEAGNGIIADLLVRPGVGGVMLLGIGAGVVSLVVNAASIRKGERTVMTFGATALGALLAFLLAGEIFFPNH